MTAPITQVATVLKISEDRPMSFSATGSVEQG